MPRPLALTAALLLTAPLAGCGDGDDEAVPKDPEEAQRLAEAEDVAEAEEEFREAQEGLEDARENLAEQKEEHRDAIAEVEEAEDSIDDARRQVAKEKADLAAEKADAEPDFEAELNVGEPAEGEGADRDDLTNDPDVKVEADPGVDVEVEGGN